MRERRNMPGKARNGGVTRQRGYRCPLFRVIRHFLPVLQTLAGYPISALNSSLITPARTEPVVNHMMCFQLRFLARSHNNLPGQLDAVRMYGSVPFVSLNSRADGVSNASVFDGKSPPYSAVCVYIRLRRNNVPSGPAGTWCTFSLGQWHFRR